VRLKAQTREYVKYFALDELTVSFDRFDGTPSPDVERAVFLAGDAAIVLSYDPVKDLGRTDAHRSLGMRRSGGVATGAGRIDPGETPEAAAAREMAEETGLPTGRLVSVARVYASPGCSTEFCYMFLAVTSLPDQGTDGLGLMAGDEDIRTHILSFERLMALVNGLAAANAPLVLDALWLARERDRLCGEG